VQIALRHLLPKQISLHGLPAGHLQMDEPELDHLISGYTREAGVRELERKIGALCRSLAANVSIAAEESAAGRAGVQQAGENSRDKQASGQPAESGKPAGAGAEARGTVREGATRATAAAMLSAPVRLSVSDIEGVLGPPRFDGPRDVAKRVAKPGIALGLAATAYGGETLYVEVEMVKGKGAVQLTGNIKEVRVCIGLL
jgi:ATP-dependent Lon protease